MVIRCSLIFLILTWYTPSLVKSSSFKMCCTILGLVKTKTSKYKLKIPYQGCHMVDWATIKRQADRCLSALSMTSQFSGYFH